MNEDVACSHHMSFQCQLWLKSKIVSLNAIILVCVIQLLVLYMYTLSEDSDIIAYIFG